MPEERKLATMLFADIVGSSAIGEARDPEVVRAALGRMFKAASEAIVAHGGTVEKFIGDAVMAVFGVPVAHDDDADRAVRAAFAIRERATEFEVRIGINTGEIVADTSREGQFLVTGGAVNTAARIQQAASPGEIVVGALTRRLTGGGIRYGSPRRIAAKGIGDVEIFPAEAMASAVPEQHRGLPGLRATLIGRDKEMRLLHDALARTAQDGAPHLVTIYGPPGAGKSRLVSEFAAAIDAPVRTGRCLPYGEGITYYPLQMILREDAGTSLADPRAVALAKLDAAVRSAVAPDEAEVVAARVRVIAGLADAGSLADVSREDLGAELRWGIRRYLERRAGSGPLVLVLEDVHWAEAQLLELLEHLAESARAPLCLICLARPDFRESRPAWGASATNASVLSLAPLSGEDTRRLIAELLAIDDLSEDVRTEVVARSEGNPLYVEEFLRMLMETGHIEHRDGRWVASPTIGEISVPPTLAGLITARLDRVSGEVKRVLQRGSLSGRLFSIGALTALGEGEAPKPELLRDAVRRDLLVEADERSVGDGRVFRFKHALIRDVAYGSLPKAERSQLHDRYGRWLEAAVPDRRAEVVEIVAHHAERSFAYADELGLPDAPALARRAVETLLEAARTAWDRDDLPASQGHYERAAAVTHRVDVPSPLRVEARTRAAAGRLWRESSTAALAHADETIAEARAADPASGLAAVLLAKAWYLATTSQCALGVPIAEEALRVAESVSDEYLVSRAMYAPGVFANWLGDLERSDRIFVNALEYMNAHGLRSGRTEVLSWLSRNAQVRGDYAASTAYRAEAIEGLEARGSHLARTGARNYRGNQAHDLGDLETAALHHREALAMAKDLGLPGLIAFGHGAVGEDLLADHPAEAATFLREAIEIYTRRGQRGFLPMAQTLAARAAVLLGDLRAARELADAAMSAALADDYLAVVWALWGSAEVAEAEGGSGEARRLFGEALALIPPAFGAQRATVQTAFAKFLIRQRKPAEARQVLERVRNFYSDPLAYRLRDEIEALLRQCDEVRV